MLPTLFYFGYTRVLNHYRSSDMACQWTNLPQNAHNAGNLPGFDRFRQGLVIFGAITENSTKKSCGLYKDGLQRGGALE